MLYELLETVPEYSSECDEWDDIPSTIEISSTFAPPSPLGDGSCGGDDYDDDDDDEGDDQFFCITPSTSCSAASDSESHLWAMDLRVPIDPDSFSDVFSTASIDEVEDHDLIGLRVPIDPDNVSGIFSTTSTNQVQQQDLLTNTLPEEVFYSICSYIDMPSQLSLGECSRRLNALTSRNEASWIQKCQKLWQDKVHVCAEAKNRHLVACYSESCGGSSQRRKMSEDSKVECCPFCDKKECSCAKEAYRLSVIDARNRQELTVEEICQSTWSFRFKDVAGQTWTSQDPWHNGGEARKIALLPNGRVMQIARAQLDNDVRSGRKRKRQPLEASPENVFSDSTPFENEAFPGQMEMRWRLTSDPLGQFSSDVGRYIHFSLNSKDLPTCIVSRSPANNWGFVIESCWGVYSSFHMPKKESLREMEKDDLKMTVGCGMGVDMLCSNTVITPTRGETVMCYVY